MKRTKSDPRSDPNRRPHLFRALWANEISMEGIEKNRVNNQTHNIVVAFLPRHVQVVDVCVIYGRSFSAQLAGYLQTFVV